MQTRAVDSETTLRPNTIRLRSGGIFFAYGPTLEHVLTAREEAATRLDRFARTRTAREEFDRRKKELEKELAETAARLSQKRQESAGEFTRRAGEKLAAIGFAKSRLEAGFTPVPPGPTGMDRLELLFSANAGEPLQPLRKIASSGELSRLMLALKTVLADADSIPTVIFDEIDVNIGGETANRVGDELALLGKSRQILSISHLAQVAARGDRHFAVEKNTENNRTVSTSRILTPEQRTREIARMLGGGPSALTHARAILTQLNKR